MKNNIGFIQKISLPNISSDLGRVSLQLSHVDYIQRIKYEKPDLEMGVQINILEDLEKLSNLDFNQISFVQIPYHLNFIISTDLNIPKDIKLLCGNIEADLDTPLEVLEEQIKEMIIGGYNECVLEVYSGLSKPIESFLENRIYQDEIGIYELQSLCRKFEVSLSFLNASKEHLIEVSKKFQSTYIYSIK
jgi:hypothetical protein